MGQASGLSSSVVGVAKRYRLLSWVTIAFATSLKIGAFQTSRNEKLLFTFLFVAELTLS
jgi:hypothetical protein